MATPARLVALVLLAAAAAGCVEGNAATTSPPTATDGVGDGRAFGEPVSLPHERRGGEPNIVVAPDGTLFVAAQTGGVQKPGLAEGTAWLWRSRDAGATWDVLKSPNLANDEEAATPTIGIWCSCDADVVVSPDGWVYYTDWWTDQRGVGHFLVERSPDGGDTWQPLPHAAPPHLTALTDRQWLLAGEDGLVALFWHHWDAVDAATEGTGARVSAVISRDHGLTWSLPTQVLGDTGSFYHAQAHPFVLPDGTLVLVFMDILGHAQCDIILGCADPFGGASVVRVARSQDVGATWDVVDIADVPEGAGAALPVGAAADASGRVLAAYNARTGDNISVFTVESLDGGITWAEPQLLGSEGLNVLPWVAATQDGRFAVGWYHGDWTGPPEEAPEGTPWHVYAAERATPEDEWRIALVDEEPVVTGPYCFGGSTCTLDRPLADFLSLAYGEDDVLHVAYTRAKVYEPPVVEPIVLGHVHVARTLSP